MSGFKQSGVEYIEQTIQHMIDQGSDFGSVLPDLLQHIKKAKQMEKNERLSDRERIKQFLYGEIIERRPYSSSKMCEEVLKFIEKMDK